MSDMYERDRRRELRLERREHRRRLRQSRRAVRAEHRRHRILRATAVLPSMATVGNALAGFAAVHFATKSAYGQFSQAAMLELWIAGWLVAVAMFFDMLDGRLARMTRRTSDFGAQLDSLSDAISFGVAPAMISLRMSIMAMRQCDFDAGGSWLVLERIVWAASGLYLACAALRLARFNVENVPDESAHMHFKGLPSPGAAAAVVSVVLLAVHAHWIGWLGESLLCPVAIVLPAVTLATALLMVSRLQYPHLVNQYIRGKKPFSYIVKLLVIGVAAMLELFATLAVVAVGFALSGPARWAWRKVFPRPAPPKPAGP
jgi:CDP-diacylglycerol--serine O-phosphatidyltransferase